MSQRCWQMKPDISHSWKTNEWSVKNVLFIILVALFFCKISDSCLFNIYLLKGWKGMGQGRDKTHMCLNIGIGTCLHCCLVQRTQGHPRYMRHTWPCSTGLPGGLSPLQNIVALSYKSIMLKLYYCHGHTSLKLSQTCAASHLLRTVPWGHRQVPSSLRPPGHWIHPKPSSVTAWSRSRDKHHMMSVRQWQIHRHTMDKWEWHDIPGNREDIVDM